MTDQCGLFDLPEPVGVPPARSPGRGRARETFLRRVVADVTVQDAGALRAQALRLLDGGSSWTGWGAGEDGDEELPDPREEVLTSSAAALEWCLEPTAGMAALLEDGAVALRFAGHWAAEPGAPLRGVPGITWAAMEVDVEQVFARAR